MQPGQHQPPASSSSSSSRLRAIGSLSSLTGTSSSSSMKPNSSAAPQRPPSLRIESSSSGGDGITPSSAVSKTRGWDASPATPIYNQFATVQSSASASNLHQNFSRPAAPPQLTKPMVSPSLLKGHSRKLSATQGSFDSNLPSAAASNLPNVGTGQSPTAMGPPPTPLTASQMAAKAAILSHQTTSHVRQRSQTVPFPGEPNEGSRRGSGSKVPVSPPMLSLTEASAPRDSGFAGAAGQLRDRMGFSPASTTATAANVVFPRTGPSSPREKPMSPQSMPPVPPEKPPSRLDKPKVKLFSRPVKIGTSKTDVKEKALPSPGKIGTALSALQRGNFSTTSLVEPPPPPPPPPTSSSSLYSLQNSSSATIRPVDTPTEDRGKDRDREKDRDRDKDRDKEKRHHFLSRQKQKLKDDYHLPLSSASSNSRPTDPNAPSSLYSFNVPASPGPGSSAFVKAKKDKWLAERSESRTDLEQGLSLQGDWSGSVGLPPLPQAPTPYDGVDAAKLGLQNHVTLDDAWPYLKAKLLVIFEGEDLRLPVEDFNRVVQMHIQWCIHKRSPGAMLEDLSELLATGFASLDRTLRMTAEHHFLPTLVEHWLFTFTSILPYMQAVFLPLELEVSGSGLLMTAEQARDFWSGVVASSQPGDKAERAAMAASLLDVRRLVLVTYRDTVMLPRYETLRSMFSRLSLEFLPSSFASVAMASPPPEPTNLSASPSDSLASSSATAATAAAAAALSARPETAMSLDPSIASSSCTSTTTATTTTTTTTTTLLREGSSSDLGRSRAVSNVSFGSDGAVAAAGGSATSSLRPFTPQLLSSVRERNVEDSKQVTDMVGRMLQCMSVLSGLAADAEGNRRMGELCKLLKLNWLGRGRTGRNRRGIVGGKVRRDLWGGMGSALPEG
ncbi:HbrB-like protein [Ophiocordyceps camponoti-floridani]|uniref:HbrB-like protein n=1 Tax=Ophiocordyceps camponoti-floridani TaxID=2030778 RepID=A0A8H4VDM7_9HYPO|nr:HbrB-like protein [Ophiocordyceps camponoti-floridani]